MRYNNNNYYYYYYYYHIQPEVQLKTSLRSHKQSCLHKCGARFLSNSCVFCYCRVAITAIRSNNPQRFPYRETCGTIRPNLKLQDISLYLSRVT